MFLIARILGLVVVTVFVTAGLAVAAALLPLLIGLGVLAALGALCLRQEVPRLAASPFGHRPLGFAVGVALGFVVVVSGVIGMTALLGGATVALTAAVTLAVLAHRHLRGGTDRTTEHSAEHAAGSPGTGVPAAGAAGGGCGRSTATTTDAAATEAGSRRLLPADPAALSTAELCRAWRVSYLLLQRARVPEALEDAAELRRRYLDELAGRDPAGFRRWLDDGARAAGDPSRYVRDGPAGWIATRTRRPDARAAPPPVSAHRKSSTGFPRPPQEPRSHRRLHVQDDR